MGILLKTTDLFGFLLDIFAFSLEIFPKQLWKYLRLLYGDSVYHVAQVLARNTHEYVYYAYTGAQSTYCIDRSARLFLRSHCKFLKTGFIPILGNSSYRQIFSLFLKKTGLRGSGSKKPFLRQKNFRSD